MSKENFIQIFEYQKLRYGDNGSFKRHHFDAMVQFNEKNQSKYFTVVHKGVQFKNYVGVIQIGGLTIEILPKADKNENPNKNLWQGVLLNMLNVCRRVRIDNVSEALLKKRFNSILEAYFEMYLDELDGLIKRGLIRKYRIVQSNQLSLKGKIVFSRNIHMNFIHKERFFCEHQLYDKDHLLHQVLYKGLKVLDGLISSGLRDKFNRIMFEFDNVKELRISASHFDKIYLKRKNKAYLRALEIAKMLILNYSPNLSSGNDNMLTLLFDMNMLWEEYIFRILHKHKPVNSSISFQNKLDFWSGDDKTKTIRPDIVFQIHTENKIPITYIIDTKWKIRDSNNPDDSDLKQMFAYNLHWQSEKSLLLFPRVSQDDSSFGNYNYKHNQIINEKLVGSMNQCKLGYIDIVENELLLDSKLIATRIFNKLDLKIT